MPATARTQNPTPPSAAAPLTAEAIIKLASSASATLPSTPASALLAPLSSPSFPAAAYLSALLTLLSRSPPSPSLLSSLILASLRLPRPPALHLFAPHLPSLDPADLPPILDLLTSNLSTPFSPDDPHPLDLLPRLLNVAIAASAEPSTRPAINKLLSADWSKPLVLKILPLFLEFPPQPIAPDFFHKVFDGMSSIDLQDLPYLVY